MVALEDVNNKMNDVRNMIIQVASSKDETAFYDTCVKCEMIFDSVIGLHPESLEQTEKRDIINVLRSLKDICLQLINIKKTVFNIVNLDDYRQEQEAKEAEEKPKSPKQMAESLEAKVLRMENHNGQKRAA